MDARLRLRAIWVVPALVLAGLALGVSSAHAQGTPIPVTPPVQPVTPVTPPIEPVTPPIEPVAPTTTARATPFAVVLVSGFNTSTPFSTPTCTTAGRGSTWGYATGPAATLTAAGLPVFTAPVANGGQTPPASCLGTSTTDIPSGRSTVIDSNGELADNQAALVAFLQFLHQSYGVANVALVGHSDGGLWSRAAISQLRSTGSSVTINSLTTIGTPHIGSFGADLAVAIASDNGSCGDLSGVEYLVCEASYQAVEAIFANLGQDVVEELSSGWLSQWNPTTSIGCSVTAMGGDAVGWDLGVGTYYMPNDGIVGQASALNQSTLIPALNAAPFTPVAPPGGAAQMYDAVHSPSLSFISSTNELNDGGIAAAVAAAVQAPPPGTCANATSGLRSALRAPASATRTASAAAATNATVVPLRVHEATRNGRLSRAHAGDAVLLLNGATVRCRGRVLPTVPLLGSSKVRVAAGICSRPLKVRGRAMKLSQTRAELHLTRSGDTLRYRLTGGKLHRVRVQVRTDGRWRTVRGGHVTVPAREHDPAVRVRAAAPDGDVLRAITRIAV
jgi:hypothetical protein